MNDIFKETFGTADTSKQTPIEIALGVDGQGMTTAKKLYEFLELDSSNYSRWFKKNITNNEFAEDGIDYFAFVTNDECGGQASIDAKLTASFAKKLSMMQKNKKGEAARNYFVGIENGTKKLFKQIPLTEHPGKVANLIRVLANRMDKQGSAPYKSAEMAQLICIQYGIQLPEDFVKIPEYEQMHLEALMKGGE